MSKTIVGLSFGNTSSSIAYIKEGKVEVIANQDGDRAIPSMLSYVHGDEYHGLQAKQQQVRNPHSTVGFFRDFLGKPFSRIDPTACHKISRPVEKDGKTGFAIVAESGDRFLSVEDAIVRQFSKLHEAAADYIGQKIDGAVLAVPTDFDEQQRKDLAALAQRAGIPILQIINEPSSALLAHVSRSDATVADKVFVVADFGGTRADGAVIAYNSGIFTVVTTLHDPELGGRLLDEALVGYLATEFEKQHSVDPRSDARAMSKLTLEAEQIKKTLSNSTTTQYGVESVSQGLDFSGSINRLRFEMAARPVFAKFSAFVEKLLAKAKLDVLDIDEVLLVGGTSWAPKIASQVASVFDSERTVVVSPSTDSKALPPDELIARGSAIQGSLLAGFDAEEISESLQPVVVNGPHLAKTIGIIQAGGSVQEVLSAYTLLPVRKAVTVEGNGKSLVTVCEVDEEVVVETHKPEPKEPASDDESDWSEDDEEYEVRRLVLKPGKTLAELAIPAQGKVDVVLNISRDLKLHVAAKSGSEQVAGVVA